MSAEEVAVAEPEPERETVESSKPRYYGFSALLSGFARMWRATLPALLIILVNAGVQAALVYTNPIATPTNWLMYLQAAASLVVLLYTGAVLSSSALESVSPGRVRFAQAYGRANKRFWVFAGWMILLLAALLGASLVPALPAAFPWAVWLVWGVFIFLPIAAVDGRRNSLMENFRAIGGHPIRWFFTWLIMTLLYVVGWLLSAVNTFFITGALAAGIAGVIGGVIVWWWLTSWACVYSSRAGAEPAPYDPDDLSDELAVATPQVAATSQDELAEYEGSFFRDESDGQEAIQEDTESDESNR